jgi:hypothetical protein
VTIKADHYFAMIPEWVLDADISAQAVRLYCVLRRYADQAGRCYPSRKRIAERMNVSSATVDRAAQELVGIGALHIRQRYNPDTNEHTSNEYLVLSTPRLTSGAGVITDDETYPADEETGLLTRDELTRANINESQEPEKTLAYASVSDRLPAEFADFWLRYPRKIGKGAAVKRWARLSADQRANAIRTLPDHAAHWKRQRVETQFIPHPATWLSQGRWDDDLSTEASGPSMPTAVERAAELYRQARDSEQRAELGY